MPPRPLMDALEPRRLLTTYATDVAFAHNGVFDPSPEYTSFAAVRGGLVTIDASSAPDGFHYSGNIRRFHADGSVDRSFTPIPTGNDAPATAQDADGRVLAASRTTLTRYTARGRIDRTFGRRGHIDVVGALQLPASIQQIVPADDGSALVLLRVTPDKKHIVLRLARVTAAGEIDAVGYGEGGSVQIVSTTKTSPPPVLLVAGPGGRAYVSVANEDRTFSSVVRLRANGSRETGYGTNGVVTPTGGVSAMAVDAQGRLLVVGVSEDAAIVTRYGGGGRVDRTFAANGRSYLTPAAGGTPSAITLLPLADGVTYVQANHRLYALTPDGRPDPTFDDDGFADLADNGRILGALGDGFVALGANAYDSSATATVFNVHKIAPARDAVRGSEDNTLYVNGDAGSDSVTIRREGARVRVSVNGRVTRVPAAGLLALKINLFGGDNVVSSTVESPVELRTGNGDDRIYASAAFPRVLPGGGRNTIAFGPSGGQVDVPNDTVGIGHNTITGDGGVLDVNLSNGSTATVRFTGGRASVFTQATIISALDQAASDIRLDVTGTASVNTGSGADRIDTRATRGRAFVDPGAGADTVLTGPGDDVVFFVPQIGPSGDDDFIDTGGGNDRVKDTYGDNTILGGSGRDSIVTGDGEDSLSGGDDNDTLRGGGGGDRLNGQAGNDRLYGQDASDTIDGGTGRDTLVGGAGNDFYRIDSDDDVLDGVEINLDAA